MSRYDWRDQYDLGRGNRPDRDDGRIHGYGGMEDRGGQQGTSHDDRYESGRSQHFDSHRMQQSGFGGRSDWGPSTGGSSHGSHAAAQGRSHVERGHAFGGHAFGGQWDTRDFDHGNRRDRDELFARGYGAMDDRSGQPGYGPIREARSRSFAGQRDSFREFDDRAGSFGDRDSRWSREDSAPDWGSGQRLGGSGAEVNWGRAGNHPSDFFSILRATRRSGSMPKNYTRSDERIKDDVCERLYHMPNVDVHDVTVEAKNGTLILEGTVSDRAMKHRIEDIAEQCMGVKDVDNRIRVSREDSRLQSAEQTPAFRDDRASTTAATGSGARKSDITGSNPH